MTDCSFAFSSNEYPGLSSSSSPFYYVSFFVPSLSVFSCEVLLSGSFRSVRRSGFVDGSRPPATKPGSKLRLVSLPPLVIPAVGVA